MLIPTVEDFTAADIVDTFDDMHNPAGLTNHWACCQVDHDITAVRSLNVPPIGTGDCVTGRLFLGGRLFESMGEPVVHTWRPDQVVRRAQAEQWQISTTTITPIGEPAVMVRIEVTNLADQDRDLDLGLWVNAEAVRTNGPWRRAEPPRGHNTLERRGSLRLGLPADPPVGMAFTGALPPQEPVVCLQGLVDADGNQVDDHGTAQLIRTNAMVAAGQTWPGAFIVVVTNELAEAETRFGRIAANQTGCIERATEQWNRELADLFEGDEYTSGTLPVLHTSNDALRQLYWWGAMGVLWFRRENPAVSGRHYDTLMPRYWQTTTFIWDYSLSSLVHALNDPEQMREQILQWIGLDINAHFGTEWLTGGPAGNWYSVNQYAMIRLVNDYVRITGDTPFLDVEVTVTAAGQADERFPGDDSPARTVGDHVRAWALAWQDKRAGSALADYGQIDNLLECVSTYVHEVASLNAANVWCMRTAAQLSRLDGHQQQADELEALADALIPEVMQLYRDGEGFFNARHPDGTLVPVRHCYDFSTVGTTIASDLDEQVRTEMLAFFDAELRTESWMRALSAHDQNAGFSVRPDHQWNGAYPAWPADSARAAIALGGDTLVAEWITGLARSTRQGPPGQAHMVAEASEPVEGGARKAPPQFPYLIDWSCSSAGAWCELVLEGIFGIEIIDGRVRAASHLEAFDPRARLTGLRVAGESFTVDRDGVSPSED